MAFIKALISTEHQIKQYKTIQSRCPTSMGNQSLVGIAPVKEKNVRRLTQSCAERGYKVLVSPIPAKGAAVSWLADQKSFYRRG